MVHLPAGLGLACLCSVFCLSMSGVCVLTAVIGRFTCITLGKPMQGGGQLECEALRKLKWGGREGGRVQADREGEGGRGW